MRQILVLVFLLFMSVMSFSQTSYTWNITSGNWSNAASWLPNRTSPAANDILIFNGNANVVVDISTSQNIGQLQINGNAGTSVIFQTSANITLNIGATGISNPALTLASGNTLTLQSTVNSVGMIINVISGYTGSISGAIVLGAGTSATQKHVLSAADANGLTFNNGSSCTTSVMSSGSPFGSGTTSSVVFTSGSVFNFLGGSSPFTSSKFNSGSKYSHQSSGSSPSFSGRSYADFELNIPAGNTVTVTGGTAVSINNLTITSGTLYFNMTGVVGHSIKGDIYVASGAALNFNPLSACTLNLNGSSAQTISGGGTVFVSTKSTLNINNNNGIILNTALVDTGTLLLTKGTLSTGGYLTLASSSFGSGNIQGANANINGYVTIQRYIGSNKQWRMIGFPFTSATNINAATLNSFYSSGYAAYTFNEAADGGQYGGNGGVNSGWVAFNSGTTTTSDKGILLIGGATSTINFTGSLNSGTQNINLSKNINGWNLIANPFASNINWATIVANTVNSNVNNAIYRYDPANNGYATYVNGVSAGTGTLSNIIENGGSFFVQCSSATTLTIQESDKIATAPTNILMDLVDVNTVKSIIQLNVAKKEDTNGYTAILRWGAERGVTDNFDNKYDAYNLGRKQGVELFVVGSDNTQYSIFHGSALQSKEKEQRVIALGMKNMDEGNYTFKMDVLSEMYGGNQAYLIDNYTQQATLISNNSVYGFTVTSDVASQSLTRFVVAMNYKVPDATTLEINEAVRILNNPSTFNTIRLITNADYNKLTWQLMDNTGRIIQTGMLNNVSKGVMQTINAQEFVKGMYFICLTGDGKNLPAQKYVKQ
jgi:hypothetical protein